MPLRAGLLAALALLVLLPAAAAAPEAHCAPGAETGAANAAAACDEETASYGDGVQVALGIAFVGVAGYMLVHGRPA